MSSAKSNIKFVPSFQRQVCRLAEFQNCDVFLGHSSVELKYVDPSGLTEQICYDSVCVKKPAK